MSIRALFSLTAAGLVFSAGLAAQSSENVGDVPPGPIVSPDRGAATWTGPGGNVLYDNGPLVTSAGTGAGGADESVLQNTTLGMTTLGFSQNLNGPFQLADDFEVPGGQLWQIDEIVFFAYQTGSTTNSPITDYRVRIWDGPPAEPGSAVVWGDLATNVLADTGWANLYRVVESASDTLRPIMANTTAVPTTLDPGTYWVEWELDGDPQFGGPFAPPITISGETVTGNALQSGDDGATFAPMVDGGTGTEQGLPFIIVGTDLGSVPVPTLGPVGLIVLVLVIAGFGTVLLRRV